MSKETKTTVGAHASTGAQIAIQSLESHGVDTVFGIPGVHTLALYDALRSSSLRHVLARHEQGAGFMADGYARASGKPGVAVIITGPGITNVATPIGEAYADSSPVLVLSSNVPSAYLDDMRGCLHDLKDQLGVMAAVTKWNGRATAPSRVRPLIDLAFSSMSCGRRQPTHLEIPLDVLDEPVDTSDDGCRATCAEPIPPADTILEAAGLLASARRPIIYCGGGAVSAEAINVVTALAELLDAPVMTSIMGKGAIAEDHPLSVGALWSPGNAVDDLWRSADCALIIGTKLGEQATNGFQLRLPESSIRIDIDPREITLNARCTMSLVGDANSVALRLLGQLRDMMIVGPGFGPGVCQETRTTAETTGWNADRREYIDALRRAIPRDGILVNDMTMMSYVACYYYPVFEPRTFMFPSGYGTLGFALPAAIGAKIAHPDKVVVPVVGDGGFQYTMAELGCAIQEQLSLPVVIFNDSTYSAVKEAQEESRGGRFIGVDLVNPDYVALAEAYGIPGVSVESPEQLEIAVGEATTRTLPTIINVPIEPWV